MGWDYNLYQRVVIFALGFCGKRLPALTMDRPTPKGNWVERLKADITPVHADKLLYAYCLCSGLVDSTLYNDNTIFVGLGASNQNLRPYGWAWSMTSIGCFVLGCFLFARLNSALGPRQRGTLVLTFFLQTAMLIITAALVQSGTIPGIRRLPGDSANTDIQSAGQIVASRALGYNEVPTVVITSLLCDLASDPKLFFLRNAKRDRRGWMTKVTGDIYAVMWLAAGIKFIISMAWVL
ncbi:hypothetical protein BDV23DRAFT_173411 [Aspergillus alliaceus]|uniref:Uncharacterized protein n=1 Tax=Petromyces alliaceus TaxID=209559 RepID=A0A5N7C4S7_PETAA|nr:hypothetical protein BDV23DRAFT_173411 [Aspergillus alliaceus]